MYQYDPGIIVRNIEKYAEAFYKKSRGSHDWEHTLRVCRLCERIGTVEDADMEVLMVAAYLHDIGRYYQDETKGAVCHAEEGARLAEPLICKLSLSEAQKNNIIHCIRAHRFRGIHKPATKEAKVLFDADKLDAIGAVGVARAFLFAGEVGARLHNPEMDVENSHPYSKDDTGYREYKMKLSKVRDRILTDEGRKLANARHDYMEKFFKRFLEEYEGKG